MRSLFAQLVDPTNFPQQEADQEALMQIFNIVFVIVGALAFLMLIISGLRFITAQGQPDKVAEARRQIVYSIIGLVIVAMAAVIVNYVLGRI